MQPNKRLNFTASTFKKIPASDIKKLSKEAGILKNVTPKTLRVTFATLAYKAGMDLKQLQTRLNHKNHDQTLAYIQNLDATSENEYLPQVNDIAGISLDDIIKIPPPKKAI